MNIERAELSKQADRRISIGGVRLFCRVKGSEVNIPPLCSDPRLEFPSYSLYARKAPGLSRLRAISRILYVRDISQVCEFVVRPISIFMVNYSRINKVVHFVNDTRSMDFFSVKMNKHVTINAQTTGYLARITFRRGLKATNILKMLFRPLLPLKQTRHRIVVKALVQILHRWQSPGSLGYGSYPCFWSGREGAFPVPLASVQCAMKRAVLS